MWCLGELLVPREPSIAWPEPADWFFNPQSSNSGHAPLASTVRHVTGMVHSRAIRYFSSCRYQVQCTSTGQDNQDLSHWGPTIRPVFGRNRVRPRYSLLRKRSLLTPSGQEDRTYRVLSQCLFQHPSDDACGSCFAAETHERARSFCNPILWRFRRVCCGYVN